MKESRGVRGGRQGHQERERDWMKGLHQANIPRSWQGKAHGQWLDDNFPLNLQENRAKGKTAKIGQFHSNKHPEDRKLYPT